MKRRKILHIIVSLLIVLLCFGFISRPFVAAARATVPHYNDSACSGKYTNLKLSYFDKVKLVYQFNLDENFKEAQSELTKEGINLRLLNPYVRKVKTNDGRIFEEIWYKSRQINHSNTVLLVGIRELNTSNAPFTVHIIKAQSPGNKSWIVTEQRVNTSESITFTLKYGKISITNYTTSSVKCVACMLTCEGICEGACWEAEMICIIPCIMLCSRVCSGPCGGS